MFHIGQKVVCVNNCNISSYGLKQKPRLNETYTIRGFSNDGEALFLEEIVNLPAKFKDGFVECSWLAFRFRPVVTKSTDTGMSILRGILSGQRVPEKV